MPTRSRLRGARLAALLLALAGTAACGGSDGASDAAVDTSRTPVVAAAAAGDDADSAQPLGFTAAGLDAYERGLGREIELVRAAQERARTAATPQERAQAAQAQWDDQTMPEGARSAGVAEGHYRRIRASVGTVLRTLDFQGAIDGPLTLDTARATPEMKRQFASDPLAALPPASAAALRARLGRLAPLWAEYMGLTAVAG